MKRYWIIICALLILVPAGVWWFSTEQVIIRRTKHFMEVMTISAGTGGALRQAKVYSLSAMLTPEIEIIAPDIPEAEGTFDKAEIESGFSWICTNTKRSNFEIGEFRNFSSTGDQAVMHFRVKAILELPGSNLLDGWYAVVMEWRKTGDGWRITKVVWKPG
ncbi:MAG: nuclear transport factor 2 family protein [Armatimonadetes bacterium]|nr:nuclear transport factor 2 family protein [Akkermansiaceae bacterium]